jgi:hypothetical protein
MKLAVINIKGKFFSDPFLDKYAVSGIEYDFATNLPEFLEKHGDFDNYDGVIMHPPLGYHQTWLDEIQRRAPDIRIAFATMNLGSTLQNMEIRGGFPLFDFDDVSRIKEYFRTTSEEQ